MKRAEAAMARLVGQPLSATPVVPETRMERVAALLQRIGACARGEANPYQRDFTKFRTELCFTKDEARGGKVALIPDHAYLREVDEALLTCSPLLIQKSRRTIITWTVCAFDVWLAAGGQDPRWPQLLQSRENRKIVIGARKLKGEGGSAEMLQERVRFLIDQIEARGLREQWPEFPEFRWRYDQGKASNGSVLAAVAQGADSFRGLGITFIHADEMGYWPLARASITTALHTLAGGGHLCGITTACAGTFAADVAAGKVKRWMEA